MLCHWSTIRNLFLATILAGSLARTPVFAQGSTVVRVEPSTRSVQVNDPATIAIKVDNISNLTAIELHLAFDVAVLDVLSVTNGGVVPADFEAQNTFNN